MIRAAFVLLAVMAAAQAQPTQAQPTKAPGSQSSPDTWLPRGNAELQVLDTVNAKAATVTLRVGQSADNASLSIVLRACVIRPPDMRADSAAFLDIADSRRGAPGFHGWMFANEPAVSMLEHPIYSVRLVGCR